MPLADGRRWRQQLLQGVVGEALLLGLRPEVGRVAGGEVRITGGEQIGVTLLGATVGRRRGEALARVRARVGDEVQVPYGERIGGRHGHVIVGARARHRYREVRVEALVRRGVGAGEVGRVAVGAHRETLDADGARARYRRAALGLGVPRESALARVRVVATTATATLSRRRRHVLRGVRATPVHQQTILHAARLHDLVILLMTCLLGGVVLPGRMGGSAIARPLGGDVLPLVPRLTTVHGVLQTLVRGAATHLAVLLHRARIRPRRDPVEGHLDVVRQTGELAGRTGQLSQSQRLHGPVFPAVGPLMAGLGLFGIRDRNRPEKSLRLFFPSLVKEHSIDLSSRSLGAFDIKYFRN